MSKHFANLFIVLLAAILFLPKAGQAESAPPHIRTLGPSIPGDTEFVFPDGIAVDPTGYVYVIDLAGYVRKFTAGGTFVLRWGGDGHDIGQFTGAPGIAADNNFVYVADMGNHRIQKFTSDGVFVSTWGTRGSDDNQLNYPFDIVVGPDGNLYVSDQFNQCVKVFTTTGVFVRKFGIGTLVIPFGIGIDPHTGDTYVVENNQNPSLVRVQRFSSSGAWLSTFGGGGVLNHPMKVAVGSDGNAYVTDRDNHRVAVFSSEGTLLCSFGTPGTDDGQFNLPFGIAFDLLGNVIVSEHYNHRLQWFGHVPTAVHSTSWGRMKVMYR